MSRSPKYSTVRISELIGRKLEQERQARERRRREERTKRAEATLAVAKAATARRCEGVAARCESLGRQPAADAAELAPMRALLDRARRALDDATHVDEIRAAGQLLDEAERLRVAASTDVLRRGTRHAAGQLAALRGLLAELEPAERVRFDPDAAGKVDDGVRGLATALDHGDIPRFTERVPALLAEIRAHQSTVLACRAEHDERRRSATATLEELSARVAELSADAHAARTPLAALSVAGEVIDEIQAELDADRPADALAIAAKLASRLDRLEVELDSAIERLSARREVLGSIIEALPALGFAADRTSLVHGEDGSIGLQARRVSGEELTVVVDADEEEHRISYLKGTAGALDAPACTSLKSLAENLNTSLRRDGFDAGAVTWDDDRRPWHPDRLPEAARRDRYRSDRS